jgi:uncharacterized protein with von Willebrand factor type A (vWA) domain
MSKMVLPMELYHAARETCLRLYVANGGDARAKWSIRPYPGTAAIACDEGNKLRPPKFTLCMPSFPLDMRLPRWKADLVAAYTVHELLHALWTDWNVVAQSRRDGLHGLTNALEDNRIEARASRGDLLQVSEARRLLEALNAHIVARAVNAPNFRLDAPEQFSFVLNIVIFTEKLGYRSDFPSDWRARVNPAWAPLFDHALARFDALRSTGDALALAHELKAMAATLPKTKSNLPKPAPAPAPAPAAASGEGDDKSMQLAPPPREPEIVEDKPDGASETQGTSQTPKGENEGDKPKDKPEGAPDASMGEDMPTPEDKSADDSDAKSEGNPNAPGGRGEQVEMEPPPAEDVTDATQTYSEANLDDLAQESAREARQALATVQAWAQYASTVLNVDPPREATLNRGGDPKRAGAAIASPAKLRRHLTAAVKSPERVSIERRQASGRLDMRNLSGIMSNNQTVFRRRVEDEGREAAVGLLLDVSGSMKGYRLDAAKAMALHMGDALKAAGVKFEIAAFNDNQLWTPKPFAKAWANDTRRAVAGMHTAGGTAMLPAMKVCAERLLKVANVSRRILLVLTDGQDSYSQEANTTLCAWYKTRGVEIVGIGLMTHGLKHTFNGRTVHVHDCERLSTVGLSELVKTLDGGAPRVA